MTCDPNLFRREALAPPPFPGPVMAVLALSLWLGGCSSDVPPLPASDSPEALRAAVIARAASLEIPGPTEIPPGDPLQHHTSGFAKTLCSAVFITGLDPADAAQNVGYFTGPLESRSAVVDTVVDTARQEVRLTLPTGEVYAAKRYGSQGCVTRPLGEDSVFFEPSIVTPNLPPPESTPWPMGDLLPDLPFPTRLDPERIAALTDTLFGPPEAMTLAVVVVHRGRIIGERYGAGIGPQTPLESWSMGKSLTGALLGVLIQQGAYELWQPAPIPEWQNPGDPRREIRIGDLMRMSSGLRIRAPQDPDYDPERGYPDHLYFYTGTVDAFHWAATRPLQWPPNTVGRYRNTDPVLGNYLIRLAVERRGENYHAFPQRALFDRIGIRSAVLETDPYGNFLTHGYEMVAARDWARLALLYAQDGEWEGVRILPEGYAEYARTLAPAWLADGRPQYGGAFFWVNGMRNFPVPEDAYYMTGVGGQSAVIVPSHDLIVVRLGKYAGAQPGGRALRQGMELLLNAVPPAGSDD